MTARCSACGRVFGSTTARALHDCPSDDAAQDTASVATDGGPR